METYHLDFSMEGPVATITSFMATTNETTGDVQISLLVATEAFNNTSRCVIVGLGTFLTDEIINLLLLLLLRLLMRIMMMQLLQLLLLSLVTGQLCSRDSEQTFIKDFFSTAV